MNYYEHHIGDYAKDTAHLSMLEHGAYRLLLDRYVVPGVDMIKFLPERGIYVGKMGLERRGREGINRSPVSTSGRCLHKRPRGDRYSARGDKGRRRLSGNFPKELRPKRCRSDHGSSGSRGRVTSSPSVQRGRAI